MSHNDPVHLVDSASPLLREALGAARRDVPDAAALARIAAKLPFGPGGGGGTKGAGPRPPAAPTALAAPSVLAGVLVGAALGALVSAATLLWPTSPAPTVQTPRVSLEAPTTSAAAPIAPAPSAERAVVVAPAATEGAGEAAPRRDAPGVPSSATQVGAGEPLGAPRTATGDVTDVETEAHLLERARDALRGDPGRALVLTEEHAARFRGGALAQEREVVAIEALTKLGRAIDARARADRFAAAYPGSAHLRRLQTSLSPRP